MSRAAFLLTAAAVFAMPAFAYAESGSEPAAPFALPAPATLGPQPAALGPATVGPQAAAAAPDIAPPGEASSRPEISIGAGLRGMVLPGAGFDPYSSNDVIMQGSVSFGLTVLRVGNASILLFAEYDAGARSATARGEKSSMTIHRLAGGAETRYQLGRRFFLAARAAPAALHLAGSITDPSVDRPLVSHTWTWGLDVSGGAGLLLGSTGPNGTKFWMTLDFGYMFAGESQMNYAPAASEEDPRKYGAVTLPAFKPAGGVSKLGLSVAF